MSFRVAGAEVLLLTDPVPQRVGLHETTSTEAVEEVNSSPRPIEHDLHVDMSKKILTIIRVADSFVWYE